VRIAVAGSIATDHLMTFPGRFADQLIPDQLHTVSLSFLVDALDIRRGGVAANICYGMGVLGRNPILVGAVGDDFADYRSWLDRHGVDTASVYVSQLHHTARFLCTTDEDHNQIASFYTGAMADAGRLSFRTVGDIGLAIVAPNDPGAMVQYAEECRTLGIPFIFDPGQQCARMSGDELRDGVTGAAIVIVNDYELELLRQKTGLGESGILGLAKALIVTRGEHGSSVLTAGGQIDVEAVTPDRIVDPTGVGDAFRGGLMKGFALGLPYDTCARMGSVAATYALEHLGGQSHAYTWDEFRKRYEAHFGALALPA
jgi:adenosine kinase